MVVMIELKDMNVCSQRLSLVFSKSQAKPYCQREKALWDSFATDDIATNW
jgi:hypothetical protein